MNSMPESTNHGEQITDSSLIPQPIAEHYETGAWKGDTPGSCGVDCACGAVFDGFDSIAEASLTLITHVADKKSGRRDDCPDWCIEDHREDDPRDDIVLHRGGEHTDSTVRRLLAATQLDIRIVSTTNILPTEPATAPTLNVLVDAELTTWEQAAELARTILDAFGYLGDLNHPAWRS